jgi:aurora kinase
LVWELKIQFFIKHENCLELYKFYKENNSIYLVLELGERSLFDLLREKQYLNEREVAYYIRQTIKAFQYLHSHNVIHRDLKPENIVLINNTVKLADFGWSIFLGKKYFFWLI